SKSAISKDEWMLSWKPTKQTTTVFSQRMLVIKRVSWMPDRFFIRSISNQLRFWVHHFFQNHERALKICNCQVTHQSKLDPIAFQQVITFIADDDPFLLQPIPDFSGGNEIRKRNCHD